MPPNATLCTPQQFICKPRKKKPTKQAEITVRMCMYKLHQTCDAMSRIQTQRQLTQFARQQQGIYNIEKYMHICSARLTASHGDSASDSYECIQLFDAVCFGCTFGIVFKCCCGLDLFVVAGFLMHVAIICCVRVLYSCCSNVCGL